MIRRKLYGGTDFGIARYTLEPECGVGRAVFEVHDVTGDSALVFLTPVQVRRLIADLKPFSVARSSPKKATRR